MIQPIFLDMLQEQEPRAASISWDEIMHHTPSSNLDTSLSLCFPQVIEVVPPVVPERVIRWTPTLPPWMQVPSGLL